MCWRCNLHVGNLGPFTPDNLAARGDETKLGDVDFDDGTLGQDTQLSVQGVLGVLLDGENGELNSDTEFGAEGFAVSTYLFATEIIFKDTPLVRVTESEETY